MIYHSFKITGISIKITEFPVPNDIIDEEDEDKK